MGATHADGILARLLGPPGGPEKQNAVPGTSRNGVMSGNQGGEPQAEIYDLLSDLSSSDTGELSALDRPLRMSHFVDFAARSCRAETTTLRKLADAIRAQRGARKSDLPWLKLATFGNVATVKGSLRHDANLEAITGIEGDYDGGVVSIAEAVERLESANVAALIYSTPSHTAAAPRWRVLAPTSADMLPADREALAERLNGALGGILAPETFARSQAYFWGAVGEAPAPIVHLVAGRTIDQAGDLPRLDRRGLPPGEPEPIDLLADLGLTEPSAHDDDDDLAAFLAPDWTRINDALAHIAADDRDDWLRIGMALHSEGRGSDEAFEVWSAWSQLSDKFNERDQRRTWDSFGSKRGRAVGIGSLYDLAKANGWGKPAPVPVPSRLTFLSPSECEAAPRRGYIVKGMLAPGDVGCIFGQPGAGKSLIAPHLGYAMVQGRDVFGMRTKPGEVFYVAAEDSHGMQGRVAALKLRHGDAPAFTVVDGVSDLLADDSPDLVALLQAVAARRPSLVFLDTLAMAFPGLEENSAEGMGRVVAVARSLAQWGAAVVLIHHSTKAEGRTPRGHSIFNGALDMAMHVEKDESGIVRGVLTKNRNGSCDRDIAFLIDTEHLGEDEDGDPVTAALVNELEPGAAPKPEKAKPSKIMLRILDRLADSSGPSPVWVSEVDWRAACAADRGVSAAENPDSRKRSVRRLIEKLSGDMQIEFRDGQVRRFGPWSDDGLEAAS
jgi:KaiC/GvpD/RAD55 family RecA-like ATPase